MPPAPPSPRACPPARPLTYSFCAGADPAYARDANTSGSGAAAAAASSTGTGSATGAAVAYATYAADADAQISAAAATSGLRAAAAAADPSRAVSSVTYDSGTSGRAFFLSMGDDIHEE